MSPADDRAQTVAVVTLGCARNEVDSEELAGRLASAGWQIVDDPDSADAVLVNTCGFVDIAKKDSIDTILAVSDVAHSRPRRGAVVAVGCLAERYGADLAAELPEADAVLSFDDYPQIADRLSRVVAGEHLRAHTATDRRRLLPITPVDRRTVATPVPGHGTAIEDLPTGWQPPILRRRLDGSPVAPVKLASGCDRRCAFCAIPSFRGSFISRVPDDVLAEIDWLSHQGVREVVLVSENSTSYGKDLGDLRALEALLARIDAVGAVERVRVAYLQPAEVRPGLLTAISGHSRIADYFDLSFQHASAAVLRRMRRFGGTDSFLDLVAQIRALAPDAGLRSNVIVGFPGETPADVDELCDFLAEARLDAIGVFGYSDEDGTEAASLAGKVPADLIRARVERVTALAEEVMAQRAEDRIGSTVRVLVEDITTADDTGPQAWGRAEHQGPDDGGTRIVGGSAPVGSFVDAVVVAVDGVDLVASAEPADSSS